MPPPPWTPPDDPEIRRLVLQHVERRRRDVLRRAAERSLAQRLLGDALDGPINGPAEQGQYG